MPNEPIPLNEKSLTEISIDTLTENATTTLKASLDSINQIILGKETPVKLAVCCILAKGHLLIEDLPGMGKTTLAHSIANTLGLDYARIQFTSDLLPADILGSAIFNRDDNRFDFQPGPIFSQLLLADEINRATPKTQSALLEAMAERQVTIEGKTRVLPEPFFVIATQNPSFQLGTYPLPESQLDRFFMRLQLGYPTEEVEALLLAGEDRQDLLATLEAVMSLEELKTLQNMVTEVTVSDHLRRYILSLLTESRESGKYGHGLSPRAGIALQHAAQSWAMMDGRGFVLPEDVQAVFLPVVEHRLSGQADHSVQNACAELLDSVPVPN